MRRSSICLRLAGLIAAAALHLHAAPTPPFGIAHLTTNSLVDPLGTDAEAPAFSWQIVDGRAGARQSAYRVTVASSAAKLNAGKPDIWDSGKVASDQSVNVAYSGPELHSRTRYYWRVRVWGNNDLAYPSSSVQWWETGLAENSEWTAKWIASETQEHKLIRESGADWIWTNQQEPADRRLYGFRSKFQVNGKPVLAKLFVTATDSPSAWIDGRQVLESQPMTPWGHMPWGTYREADLTGMLHDGSNVLAVGATVYESPHAAMSAVLLWKSADGAYHVVRSSDEGWKGSENPRDGWYTSSYDDTGWQNAMLVSHAGGPEFGRPWPADSVNYLRKIFTIDKPVRSARLFATALGAYRFRVDGKPVGDQILAPGWTDYRERVVYQEYDLTGLVHRGKNAIGATLAPGWYSTPLQWLRQPYNYGNTPPALRAQLRLDFTDGTSQWVETDRSWQAHDSPILQAEIYDGESYDARREVNHWDWPSDPSSGWKPVDVVQPVEPAIVPQSFEPIRAEQTLKAVKIYSPKPGLQIYDFGQNLAGVARLKVQGPAGLRIRLRFAEVLNPDGTVYTENLRSAKATDSYVLKGGGLESYTPEFTFHGFRYVEISGLTTPGDETTLAAIAFHTDAPFTVKLTTGSSMINKLWSNIQWGQRSNFVGLPTDCPQRDERLGWTADAQVFWRTASYNMDLASFTRKFATDIRGTAGKDGLFGIFAPGTSSSANASSPGWSDAGVIIPFTGWLQYGDAGVAERNWDAMGRYLSVIEEANPDHLWRNQSGIGFGDWLAPGMKTSNMLVATAYWAYDAKLMMQMAHALHKSGDERKYRTMFDAVTAAFQNRYIRADGTVTGGNAARTQGGDAVEQATGMEADDGSTGAGTQTGYALALYIGLVPDTLRAAIAGKLVALIHKNNDLLGTGFLGTPVILPALADNGYADLAYKLLLNTSYPSWGYQVEHGATTMWERWNGDRMMNDPGMNSFNHYAYGAVAAWIYEYAAGVDATGEGPGYRRVYLHPHFSRALGSIDFTYRSTYGPIRSQWLAGASGPVKWNVTIPANASGYLELTTADAARYRMDGHPLTAGSTGQDGTRRYEVPAGPHAFQVVLQ